jgi:Tfp pilus assembly protein PilN
MKKQDMNLLLVYRAEQKRKANKMSPMQVYTIVLIGAILIVGAFALKLFVDDLNVKNEIKSIETYINDPSIIEKMQKIDKLQSDIKQLDGIAEEAKTLKDVVAYKPRFDSQVLDVVFYEKPSTLKITNIDFASNTLTLDYSATYVSDVSNYALRLQRTFSFADVSYSGYTYNENGTYSGTISLIMKGGN